MNVLIACEESQRVCIEFRNRGHNAFSCDLQECSGGFPQWHIHGDVLKLLKSDKGIDFFTCDNVHHFIHKWDIIIAHPPCTYLSNAGSCRLVDSSGNVNSDRFEKGVKAKEFFLSFLNADCDHICVENPIPNKRFSLPPYSQIIQPFYFGDPYTKSTCLWLKGLPPLYATDVVQPVASYVNVSRSSVIRSKTFIGVARAMAAQWDINKSFYLWREV